MDNEAKPEAAETDKQQPEQSGVDCADQNTAGEFTLSELLSAYQRNLDAQRPVAWPTPRRDK
jgi:hypothetical protein